jgi:hypothetical protein
MLPGRHNKEQTMKRTIIIFILALMTSGEHEAAAFWGSDSSSSDSGLDVSSGFDINTITTITGTVVTPPGRKGQEQHTELSLDTPRGTMTVVLGPWAYWEKQTITIAKNQELVITGSLAQGKDGLLYVFAQCLENKSNGETVVLRSESGKPLWSHNGASGQNGSRQTAGSGTRSGAGNRGSGMRGGRR